MGHQKSREHRVIKLFTCNSGIGAESKEGFAWKFWEAMHNRKEKPYAHLWVAAYNAYVKTPREGWPAHQLAGDTEDFNSDKANVRRASEARVLIAPEGKVYGPGSKVPELG
jgi:hypothetical protein